MAQLVKVLGVTSDDPSSNPGDPRGGRRKLTPTTCPGREEKVVRMKTEESGEGFRQDRAGGAVSWPVWIECFRLVCFRGRRVGMTSSAMRSSLNLFRGQIGRQPLEDCRQVRKSHTVCFYARISEMVYWIKALAMKS